MSKKKRNKKEMSFKTKFTIFIVCGLVILFLMYYLCLPIINLRVAGFYVFLAFVALYVSIIVCTIIGQKKIK